MTSLATRGEQTGSFSSPRRGGPLIRAGRFTFPVRSVAARTFLQRNLLSLHGRGARILAMLGCPPLDERDADPGDTTALLKAAAAAGGMAPAAITDWLLVNDYDRTPRDRRIVFFLTASGAPLLVIKNQTSSAAGESLRREYRNLCHVAEFASPLVRASVPRPIAFTEEAGEEYLVQSALPGEPVAIRMQRSLVPYASHVVTLASAGQWLGELHVSTRSGSNTSVHGDFWTRNLLSDPRRHLSGVVDWEWGAITGSPWTDLFTLPLNFVVDAPRWTPHADPLEPFRRGFMENTRLATGVANYFRAYQRIAGVSAAQLRDEFDRFLTSAGSTEREVHLVGHAERRSAMRLALNNSSTNVFTEL